VEDPAPYSGCAGQIKIVHAKGEKVAFLIDAIGNLVLQGDPGFIASVSRSAMNFGRDFEDGTHIHIDYQGEDHFVSQKSFSMVFRKSNLQEKKDREM
jgi:hypothetical protein